ncbi:MAG: DUF3047 domain-containing protein [Gammaproteobacteria bacterium]|nr:DUF3047 domain-containing protein [Gammaproteobacteria bacterium]
MQDLNSLHRTLMSSPGFEALGRACLMCLPGNVPPWQATGLRLAQGQHFSLFAEGRLGWSARNPGLHGGPRFHLWARVTPGGRAVNLAADSGTFIADVAGELELGIYMGLWADASGTLATSPDLYTRLQGELHCLAVAWQRPAAACLEVMCARSPHPALSAEWARLRSPVSPPAGWAYLTEAGQAEIFRESSACEHDAHHATCSREILLEAEDDQGIITHAADVPLGPDTRLCWRWSAECLPSALAEDRPQTHDYFSIATEFDNGRDLTWIWSSTLAPGTHFPCPVAAWSARETHFVVRRGMPRLGEWHEESRWVQADVATAMGTPPARIVRVWLICVATFQHGRARARFADIRLEGDGRTLRIL